MGILLKELVAAISVPMSNTTKIIHKCTQINPNDRFKSVKELKQEIEKINQSSEIPQSKHFTWKSLIPPGYRTLTPWKIWVSSLSYIMVFWLSLSLESADASGHALWIVRLIFFLNAVSHIWYFQLL